MVVLSSVLYQSRIQAVAGSVPFFFSPTSSPSPCLPDHQGVWGRPRKVDARLPGKENSNSYGARPVHLMITAIKWIRTSRLSMKKSLSLLPLPHPFPCERGEKGLVLE